MHYVIGDVHGCYEEMMALLARIEAEDTDAQIIFVGDFIDRGPMVWETLCWAREHITADGKYQSVRGNHEQMAIDYINSYNRWYAENIEPWQPHRSEPGCQYDIDRVLHDHISGSGISGMLHPRDLQPYLEFFENMPYDKLLKIQSVWGREISFRIVHAYYEHNDLPAEQQHYSNLWMRMDCGNLESDEIHVHGHTPTFNLDYISYDITNTKPGMISYRKNDINVDGGCTFAKIFPEFPDMLCAIRLEDLEEIYPCTIGERYAQIAQRYKLDFDADVSASFYSKEFMEHRFRIREQLLRKMGHPDFQNRVSDESDHQPGSPKYMEGEDITFFVDGKQMTGTIDFVYEWGMQNDRSQPYYGILVNDRGTFMMYQEIPESDIAEEEDED